MKLISQIIVLALVPNILFPQMLRDKRTNDATKHSLLLIEALRKDLEYQSSTSPIVDPEWYNTMTAVIQLQSDPQSLFQSTISKTFRNEEYDVEVHSRRTLSPIDGETSILIFPFLPSSESNKATLASFRNFTEPVFTRLPCEITNYFKKQWQFALDRQDPDRRGLSEYILVRLSGESLRKELPEITQTEYFLVSPESVRKSRIESVEFLVQREYGAYQIRAEFADTTKKFLFAIPASTSPHPELLTYNPSDFSLLLPPNLGVVSIPVSPDGPIYYGTDSPKFITVDLLWNPKDSTVHHLKASFGVIWGNEDIVFQSNQLLEFAGRRYILRLASNYAALVYPEPGRFQVIVLADETTPEI